MEVLWRMQGIVKIDEASNIEEARGIFAQMGADEIVGTSYSGDIMVLFVGEKIPVQQLNFYKMR